MSVAEIQQRCKRVRFGGPVSSSRLRSLQLIQFASQTRIFHVRAVEADVAAPDAANFPETSTFPRGPRE